MTPLIATFIKKFFVETFSPAVDFSNWLKNGVLETVPKLIFGET